MVYHYEKQAKGNWAKNGYCLERLLHIAKPIKCISTRSKLLNMYFYTFSDFQRVYKKEAAHHRSLCCINDLFPSHAGFPSDLSDLFGHDFVGLAVISVRKDIFGG